ncbi:MAG: (2Fe-2S)-binding protein [Deltaproteobacteria bacterium]|nr:(2Fe-2S)-binding protein [Deltaproteobacteria bacterium]MBI3294997.1 (2Fe-2S)-binding protein [Deltaproteobacteria bacterium]
MKPTFKLKINGKAFAVQAHPLERLLDVLREQCGLSGTKEGCGEGECGACSVLLNGELVNSCLVPIAQAAGAAVLTVEGLASKSLSALQKSFLEHGGAQCGICTPGMLIAASALLKTSRRPNEKKVREALAGNLCRCTGYQNIVESVVGAHKESR